MLLLLLLLTLSIVGTLVVRRSKAGAKPVSQAARTVTDAVAKFVGGNAAPSHEVITVERNIVGAVFASGVRTLRTVSLVFGNTITVSISPRAEVAIRPVRTLVEEEVTTEILERAQAEGFALHGRPKLLFVTDASLTGLEARVRMAIDENTPGTHQVSEPSHVPGGGRGPQEPVTLHWLHADQPPYVLPTNGSQIHVGRSSTCDFRIDSPLVSARHVELTTRDHVGALTVLAKDCQSRNGTSLDGVQMAPGMAHEVKHGSILSLGPDVRIRVIVCSSVDQDTAPPGGTPGR